MRKRETRRGCQDASMLVRKLVEPMLDQKHMFEKRIMLDWPAIVGKKVASMAKPKRIVFAFPKAKQGVLHLEVKSSSQAFLLHTESQNIKEKIATYFGYPVITNIQWIHATKQEECVIKKTITLPNNSEAQKQIKALTQSVEDLDLKTILESLGQLIYNK